MQSTTISPEIFPERAFDINPCKVFYGLLKSVTPRIPVITTRMMKIKKIVLAIDAAPSAMPVNPKSAATRAITKKIAVHLNIIVGFKFNPLDAFLRAVYFLCRKYFLRVLYLFFSRAYYHKYDHRDHQYCQKYPYSHTRFKYPSDNGA
jgi:hypothetical protein